jgi:hypothetical protein
MTFYVIAQLKFKHRIPSADAIALLVRGIG